MNLKKRAVLGAGLLTLIVLAIITSIYISSRADANSSSANTPAVEAANMDIDVKIDNGLIEPESAASLMEGTSSSSNQQSSMSASPNVDVTVNGTPVTIPENGSIQKEVTTEDGSASINISSQSSQSSGTSRYKSSIKVDSDSSVDIRTRIRE